MSKLVAKRCSAKRPGIYHMPHTYGQEAKPHEATYLKSKVEKRSRKPKPKKPLVILAGGEIMDWLSTKGYLERLQAKGLVQ